MKYRGERTALRKRRLQTIMRYLETGIPESKRAKEIERVANEFREHNEIIEVTDQYFRYQPKTEWVTTKSGLNKEGKMQYVLREVSLPEGEGPVLEMGYTKEGQQYVTNGSLADYNRSESLSAYLEEHFQAVEELEERAEASGDLHHRLVLWFYNWLTIDVIYEHAFMIEFDGTSGIDYITKEPEKILPMTEEALESRALRGDPRDQLRHSWDTGDRQLYEDISKVDNKVIERVLDLARTRAVKIRLEEIKE
ncbi:MAG: hypothetical protein ACOC3C_07565 [Candidatus Thorarchaeota archaeon]